MLVVKSPLSFGIHNFVAALLLASLFGCSTTPVDRDSGEIDAIEAAQRITKN